MSSKFGSILRLAQKTFERGNESLFLNNFKLLQEMVNEITCKDLGIVNPDELFNDNRFANEKAPCSFMHIFENDNVSLSVFVMRGDFSMPLHDHPQMYGLVKVLYGKLRIQSYSMANIEEDMKQPFSLHNNKPFKVIREMPVTRTSSSACSVLTPIKNNFHELTAQDNVAAFFDILGPPYDTIIPKLGRRYCTFYNVKRPNGNLDLSSSSSMSIDKKEQEQQHEHEVVYLEKSIDSNNYYCDTLQTPKIVEEAVSLCNRELSAAKVQ